MPVPDNLCRAVAILSRASGQYSHSQKQAQNMFAKHECSINWIYAFLGDISTMNATSVRIDTEREWDSGRLEEIRFILQSYPTDLACSTFENVHSTRKKKLFPSTTFLWHQARSSVTKYKITLCCSFSSLFSSRLLRASLIAGHGARINIYISAAFLFSSSFLWPHAQNPDASLVARLWLWNHVDEDEDSWSSLRCISPCLLGPSTISQSLQGQSSFLPV